MALGNANLWCMTGDPTSAPQRRVSGQESHISFLFAGLRASLPRSTLLAASFTRTMGFLHILDTDCTGQLSCCCIQISDSNNLKKDLFLFHFRGFSQWSRQDRQSRGARQRKAAHLTAAGKQRQEEWKQEVCPSEAAFTYPPPKSHDTLSMD